jgi:hypothetical protein
MRRRISIRSACGSATSSSCGMPLDAGDHRCTGRLIGPITSRRSSGSSFADSSVEPTRPTATAALGLGRVKTPSEKGRGTILVQRRPGIAVVGSEEGRPSVVRLVGRSVLACRTPRTEVRTARPQARIAAISTLLPTMFMTRVRL